MTFVLSAALLLALGACSRSGGQSGSPCLDRCTASDLSALERSTCELECSQLAAKNQPAPAPAPAPAPTPAATPPATPATTSPPQTPAPAPVQPRPATPQPAPVKPAPTTPPLIVPAPTPGPSMAELQQRRAACETGCNAEANPGDRATCRLQCAQITDRPQTAPAPRPGAPTTTIGTPQPTADPNFVARCQQGCNEASTSETDRATCRLNCSASAQVVGQPQSYYVLHGQPPPEGDSRANVIRSSGNVAGQTNPSTPPSTPPPPADQQRVAQCAAQAQTCNSGCDTRLTPCLTGCDQGKLSATDRATCKLTCEGDVDVCRDDCRAREGSCRAGK